MARMARPRRGSRTHSQPDQQPMDFMMPTSKWVPPADLPDLRGMGPIGVDTETRDMGLAAGRGPGWVYGPAGWICGVSMSVQTGPGEYRSVYAPVRHPDTDCLDLEQVIRWTEDHMQSDDLKVFQNAPYDLGWLQADWGIRPPERLADTIAAAFTVDEQRFEYNLSSLCRWLGIPEKEETLLVQAAEAMGCDPKADLWRLPARYVGPYAEGDAEKTLQVWEALQGPMDGQGVRDAYQLEADLIPMVLEMRRRGIRIDTEEASRVSAELLEERDEVLAELGRRLSWTRPVTIQEIDSDRTMVQWFEREQVPYPSTEKNNPSFKAEWMEKSDHWLPCMVSRASKLHDAGNKFLQTYILDYTHLGRIHAEIHQYRDGRGGTRTTRFAYSNPPLQQMPSRNPDIARKIRGVFLPEEGEVWGALDYSQQEYRLIVHFAYVCRIHGVEKAVQMYRDDPATDFHSMVAELTGLPRRSAKDVNFAKAFGAGVPKFALMTGMTLDDARETMGQYDQEMPFVKLLSEFCSKRAQQRGFLRLLDGARARFEKWEPRWVDFRKQAAHMKEVGWSDMPTGPCSLDEARERTQNERHFWYRERLTRAHTHKSMNSLIQGSAARQTKMAMRACWREGIVPLLQMHDELSSSFSEEGPALRMREIMRDVVTLEVPMLVDAEFGPTWGQAKETDGYGATFAEAMRLVRG